MNMDRLINILIPVLLIEMMAAIGLRVSFRDLGNIVKHGRLMLRTVLANYLCVPAVAVALLLLVDAKPMVAIGFLILAVCPGAPFGPSCTALARGNVPVAVGVMTFLAVSSAIAAPMLLHMLAPLVAGDDSLQVDVVKIFRTLLVTQLLPLLVGLCVRHWLPRLADWLQKPADKLTALLSLLTVCAILFVHFHLLMEIRLRGYLGNSPVGWQLGCGLAVGGPDTALVRPWFCRPRLVTWELGSSSRQQVFPALPQSPPAWLTAVRNTWVRGARPLVGTAGEFVKAFRGSLDSFNRALRPSGTERSRIASFLCRQHSIAMRRVLPAPSCGIPRFVRLPSASTSFPCVTWRTAKRSPFSAGRWLPVRTANSRALAFGDDLGCCSLKLSPGEEWSRKDGR